jgi:hypothetical protein
MMFLLEADFVDSNSLDAGIVAGRCKDLVWNRGLLGEFRDIRGVARILDFGVR